MLFYCLNRWMYRLRFRHWKSLRRRVWGWRPADAGRAGKWRSVSGCVASSRHASRLVGEEAPSGVSNENGLSLRSGERRLELGGMDGGTADYG